MGIVVRMSVPRWFVNAMNQRSFSSLLTGTWVELRMDSENTIVSPDDNPAAIPGASLGVPLQAGREHDINVPQRTYATTTDATRHSSSDPRRVIPSPRGSRPARRRFRRQIRF